MKNYNYLGWTIWFKENWYEATHPYHKTLYAISKKQIEGKIDAAMSSTPVKE